MLVQDLVKTLTVGEIRNKVYCERGCQHQESGIKTTKFSKSERVEAHQNLC